MEAVLRQSKAVCPFLKKTSPSTLRALSTSAAHSASPAGGSMSNLQLLGRRCPVMGKALSVQSHKSRPASATHARAYHTKLAKANIHTSGNQNAQAVDI